MGAIIAKAVRQGFLAPTNLRFVGFVIPLTHASLFRSFRSILQNPHLVLNQLLPSVKHQNNNLHERAQNREIPFTKSVIYRKTFIMKMLYLESY